MMRAIILVSAISLFLLACNKDKYTSAPQIKYKSVSPNYSENIPGAVSPIVTLSVTDAEGDIGKTDDDTARIFLKNMLTGEFDSLDFPNLNAAAKKNLKAEILVSVSKVIGCAGTSGSIDTLYYEIYITDFAKNKSNTIVTGDPTYFLCP